MITRTTLTVALALCAAIIGPVAVLKSAAPKDPGRAAPVPVDPRVVEEWVERLSKVTTHNAFAFGEGNQIAALPPDIGYAVAEKLWGKLTEDQVKTAVLKVFAFARHPRVLDVLHLGATDKSLNVQNYALGYLHNYSFRNFAEDYPAYLEWHKSYAGKMPDEIIAANAKVFVAELKAAEGVERQAWARRLGPNALELEPGNKTTYPHKKEYLLKAGLLEVMTQWLNDPDNDVLNGALGTIYALQPDHEYVRRVIVPLVERLPNPHYYAVKIIAATHEPWAYDLLVDILVKVVARRNQQGMMSASQGLAELKDARAVPVMIGLIDADRQGDHSQNATYWVGWFGLNRWTGVTYDQSHDGAWWRDWWKKNKTRFPQEIQELEIPAMKKRLQKVLGQD